ncbi:Zn-dependent metallo-hydrolase, RNA specificity domain, partial [Dillenia turbinata]
GGERDGDISSGDTPLWSAQREHPLSYLVSTDGFNFLIDRGWNDHFDPSLLHSLSSVASTIDALLLSHPDILHLGALPYAVKQFGLSAPVYDTEPVFRLGLFTMYDHFLSRKQVSEFDLFTLDDIDKAFQNVTRLTYSENNHLSESFVRPAVLIMDAYNELNNQPSRWQRDLEFLDAILKTLRADGNVLLPVDTAGRVLELILRLEQHRAQNHLTYPIFFLTYVASNTIEYVKSFLEWMGDSIAKHVTLLINKNELEKVPGGPKIVLASMASLEVGFSQFVEWASDAMNVILFSERGQFATLALLLQSDPPPKAVKVVFSKRVPLVGEELIAYEEEQNRIKKEEAAKANFTKEKELKASLGSDPIGGDPMVIDAKTTHASSNGNGLQSGGYRDIPFDGFVPPLNCVNGDQDDKLDKGVQVKCSLVYLDFEGRSDGRSIKLIHAHVAPLKLVLVHGSAEVQLFEKLMSNVLFKKLGDYEIAWVAAEVGKTVSGMFSLFPLSTAAPPHKSVYVGDLKMADFKQLLASKGGICRWGLVMWRVCDIVEGWRFKLEGWCYWVPASCDRRPLHQDAHIE